MTQRPRYAILEHLLTSVSASAPSAPASAPTLVSASADAAATVRVVPARCASFTSLLDLTSGPLPKLSPGEVDDVLGSHTAALNVSLESIPALFTPNNQCSEADATGHTASAASVLYSGPPGPPKRACSAPAHAVNSPEVSPPMAAWGGAGWRQRPVKSLITTSADIFKAMEPKATPVAVPASVPATTTTTTLVLADAAAVAAEVARRRAVLRFFPSLQLHRQPRVLLSASLSAKPRPLPASRQGLHVEPLQCRVSACMKQFRSSCARNQHYAVDHPDETFACPHCPLRLTTKLSLDFHRRKKHQESVRRSKECPIDGCVRKFYVENRLVNHLRVHHQQRCLPCLIEDCEARFISSRERAQHLRKEHNRPAPPVQAAPLPCADCSRHFASKALLTRHRRRQHRPSPPPPPSLPPPPPPPPTQPPAQPPPPPPPPVPPVPPAQQQLPPCAICQAVFGSWEQLSTHLAAHARLATDMYEQQQQQQEKEKEKQMKQELAEKRLQEKKLETAEVAVGTEEETAAAAAVSEEKESGPTKPEVLLACPFRECGILCKDHALFREHFARHFTGEIPTEELAGLLPPDCLSPVPDPLPAITFVSSLEDSTFTNFNDTETSSLFQALDLNLLSAITEEAHDSELLDQMLAPDLASALTLPDAALDLRWKLGSKKGTGSVPGQAAAHDFLPLSSGCLPVPTAAPHNTADAAAPSGLGPEDGMSCARTCPRRNQQLADLAKRRKALLLERVTLGFEPRHRSGGGAAHLKDVMRQIFNSKALPSKYPAPPPGPEETEVESEMLAPLPDWLGVLQTDILAQPADTPIDPPMLDQLL